MITINPIPAFDDNYLWLISNNKDAVIVDPGDALVVNQYLDEHNLNLIGILVTHHHADHTAGVKDLKDQYGCPVWGPKNDPVKHIDHYCVDNDKFEIPQLKLNIQVISVPGHTLGHIAYFIAESGNIANSLFCGDTIFSGGCGRLFEGTAIQMWQSIQKIMVLPEDTLIYPAHEYTLANLTFAREVEPDNQDLIEYSRQIEIKRAQGTPSLPTILKNELLINPFMRVQHPNVIEVARAHSNLNKNSGIISDSDIFACIRQWKDTF